MCTLALLWKVHPAAPLVIAQCRDELLDRPALDVARWTTDNAVEVVSGRDAVAGGTWFGVGPRVVCGLTNRRDEGGPRRGALSRGALVVSALEAPDVERVARDLGGEDGGAYGPFSLLAVDGARMIYADNAPHGAAPRDVATARGARDDGATAGGIRVMEVAAGVHVLGNFGLDNPADPVVATVGDGVRDLMARAPGGADEAALVDGLKDILARHGTGWPCVHRPDLGPAGYGTRSAGVLVWRESEPVLWTNPTAPHDKAAWRDSSALLRVDAD